MGFEHYRVSISFNEEKNHFIASIPELPSFQPINAETRGELMEKLDDALDAAAQQSVAETGTLPKPIDTDEDYDGQLALELGKTLHRELAYRAIEERTSVEKLAITAISAFVAARSISSQNRGEPIDNRDTGRGRRRQQQGGRGYHNIMEDKASFLEYVRQQERGMNTNRPRRRRKQRED